MERKRSLLITGISGCIGKNVAKRFLEQGYNVTGFDIRESEGINALREYDGFSFIKGDITSAIDVKALFDEFLGCVNLIINCAGILRLQNIQKSSIENWKEIIDVNLTGSFYMTKYAISYYKKNHIQGDIILLGSRWGISGTEKDGPYATSKSALRGFVKSVQKENITTGIRCILVSPGSVLTEMSKFVDQAVNQEILHTDDIADLLIYLANTPRRVILEEISIKAYPYDFINS